MKLLVVGSRSIQTYDLEKHIPGEISMIITGGANGIDSLAEKYADRKHLSKLILRPQYNRYGKGAPLKRNEQLVEFCDMALIGIASRDEIFLQKTVVEIEKKLSHYLQNEFNDVKLVVFGPFEAPVYKVKETYRMRFVVKCKSNKRTRALFRTVLNETMSKFGKRVTVAIDINPNSL